MCYTVIAGKERRCQRVSATGKGKEKRWGESKC